MNEIMYRKAAENLAGEPVSIENDGSVWVDSDGRYLDIKEVKAEYEKLTKAEADKIKADQAATAAAIAHAKSLGFTDAMIAVMYPNLGA